MKNLGTRLENFGKVVRKNLENVQKKVGKCLEYLGLKNLEIYLKNVGKCSKKVGKWSEKGWEMLGSIRKLFEKLRKVLVGKC